MPKVCYIQKRFNDKTLARISQANEIITEYMNQGYTLTLRQLYYQFVSRDLIPNKQTEYKKLGVVVSDARLAGMIDWNSIEDRTRNLQGLAHWDNPSEIVEACASQFRVDMWERQVCRPVVWIEKDALIGVIEGVCNKYDVPYFSCRGYTSQSEMWKSAMNHERYMDAGQRPIILHLGDHDPSGLDMTDDIIKRQEIFMGGVEVRRIALNEDQIKKYNPPPNPAKMTDSRFDAYMAKYGQESWELDALEPRVMSDLIEKHIKEMISTKEWNQSKQIQVDGRAKLRQVAEDLNNE
jgi:hypothetical protein